MKVSNKIFMILFSSISFLITCSAQSKASETDSIAYVDQEAYIDLASLGWMNHPELVQVLNKQRRSISGASSKYIGFYSKVPSVGDTVVVSVVEQNHKISKDLFGEFVKSQGTFITEISDVRKEYETLEKYFEQDFYQKTLIDSSSKIIVWMSRKTYAGEISYHLKVSLYKNEMHVTIESIFEKKYFEEIFPDFDQMISLLKWK